MPSYSHLNPNTTPLVIVKWADIVEAGQWNEEEESDCVECWTSGWLLEDNVHHIKIASTYDWRSDHWGSEQSFPKAPPEYEVVRPGQVLDVKILKEAGDA